MSRKAGQTHKTLNSKKLQGTPHERQSNRHTKATDIKDYKIDTMSNIPNDPMMLMSFINMKLRDFYPTLDELCEDMGIDKAQLLEKLGSIGFEYSPENNRFW